MNTRGAGFLPEARGLKRAQGRKQLRTGLQGDVAGAGAYRGPRRRSLRPRGHAQRQRRKPRQNQRQATNADSERMDGPASPDLATSRSAAAPVPAAQLLNLQGRSGRVKEGKTVELERYIVTGPVKLLCMREK